MAQIKFYTRRLLSDISTLCERTISRCINNLIKEGIIKQDKYTQIPLRTAKIIAEKLGFELQTEMIPPSKLDKGGQS